jgi:DNA polymerase II
MPEYTGWLLDLYPAPGGGVKLWLLGEDDKRYCFQQALPATAYAAGPTKRLRSLWQWLEAHPAPLKLSRTRRRDLFQPQPLDVLAVETPDHTILQKVFFEASQQFPDLSYYDVDIPLPLRYAAVFGTFPLCRCRVDAWEDGTIRQIHACESPWDVDLPPPPLRILSLEPDCDPRRTKPDMLNLRLLAGPHGAERTWHLKLNPARPMLASLGSILRRHDPDLLLSAWGDKWLLPELERLSKEWKMPLPLNRDPAQGVETRPERTYFSYGQVIYRDRQALLFGRCHIDIYNAVLFHDYGLDGVYELCRVTSLPLQTVARVSPGSGISAMQMVTALRDEVLVPWHKQQAERPKTAWQFLRSDQGGMVYQPLVGLHRDVAELDFISMYPSIMVHCNISPETVPIPVGEADEETPGLIPRTLAPLLDKRLEIKHRLAQTPAYHPRRRGYKAQASAHKWLLVTCFGYLGYKNARFGRIEAHESVTAYGREALLRAKEAAEDLGFNVLHMYVDGLWVQQKGHHHVEDFQVLMNEIVERTGLPIALEGIYNWIAFLSSRSAPRGLQPDRRVSVANRYFGAFRDGSLKMRGIEVRRRDTPLWVAEMQMEILELMAHIEDPDQLPECLPAVLKGLRKRLRQLRTYRIPLETLCVAQKMSRELSAYRTPSPAARAAAQLAAIGTEMRPGQMVRFLYTLGNPGVYAWDLPQPPNPKSVDVARYTTLLLRAAASALEPLNLNEEALRYRLTGYLPPVDIT